MKHRIRILTNAIGLIALAFLLLSLVGAKPLGAAEPIKVGAIVSLVGWAGFLGTPQKEAIEIVADEVNRKGGVLGRQIEVSFEDDQSNPTNSAIAATKLIRDRKVCAVIGTSNSSGCTVFILGIP